MKDQVLSFIIRWRTWLFKLVWNFDNKNPTKLVKVPWRDTIKPCECIL